MTWQVGPTVMTCQMTGRWHGMPTVHAGVMLASWWHHHYPGLARGSGRLVFGACDAWRVSVRVTARAEVFDIRFRRGFQQWLHLFLLYTMVWAKHNFDNFYFWAKSNTPLNHRLWYQLLGNSGSPMRGPGVYWYLLIGGLSTLTQYFTWFGKTAYIHGRCLFY